MTEGTGFGKVILFGEHFVVYGLPAIASALGGKTLATVERTAGKGFEVIDDRQATPGYKKKKAEEQAQSLKNIFSAMGIRPDETPFRITLAGDLFAASGVGASAASCAAIARALNGAFELGFDDEKINEIAYEGEKGYHGTPSGIDNTAAVFGGMLLFRRNLEGGPPFFEKLKVRNAFEIVEGNTGITASTVQVVEDVRKLQEEDPESFASILKDYETISKEACQALESDDLNKLGGLMNENMELLRKIGVSCDELETLIRIAHDNGAIGAKLTGTGRGGLMVALTPGKDLQERVAAAMEKAGVMTFRTSIGAVRAR